jgi:5-methylcytosine-specific restriction endonuclease McrA
MSHRPGVLSKLKSRARSGRGGRATLKYVRIILQDPCVYCGEFGADSVDHIVAVVNRDKLMTGQSGDHWSNLAPCHRSCNSKKGKKGILHVLMDTNTRQSGTQVEEGPDTSYGSV